MTCTLTNSRGDVPLIETALSEVSNKAHRTAARRRSAAGSRRHRLAAATPAHLCTACPARHRLPAAGCAACSRRRRRTCCCRWRRRRRAASAAVCRCGRSWAAAGRAACCLRGCWRGWVSGAAGRRPQHRCIASHWPATEWASISHAGPVTQGGFGARSAICMHAAHAHARRNMHCS